MATVLVMMVMGLPAFSEELPTGYQNSELIQPMVVAARGTGTLADVNIRSDIMIFIR